MIKQNLDKNTIRQCKCKKNFKKEKTYFEYRLNAKRISKNDNFVKYVKFCRKGKGVL